MKKIISILLVLAMVLSMAVTAFADEEQAPLNITIGDGADRDFVAYKLLDVSVALKEGAHHIDHEGEDHKDTCYNYDYTINNDTVEIYNAFKSILQAETLANGRNELWENTTKPEGHPELVTDEQIIAYLAYQTGDTGVDFKTMRQVADRIYRAILAYNSTAADDKKIESVESENGVFEDVDKGYWLIVDVTAYNDGQDVANSLVLVDTVADGDITINVKTSIPTIEVKVKDIEDSESNTIVDKPWLDTADHDAGDTVPFKVTATLPSNLEYYKPNDYSLAFDINLPAGFALDANSVKVYMYETKHKADVDIDMNDYVSYDTNDYATKFTINTENGFTVSCDNIFAISGVNKDTAFVVYFEAELSETFDNAETDAIDGTVVGSVGNTVSAILEYSNNPYDATSKGQLSPDEAVVYTYEIIVNKVDSHGHALEGAGFTLYKKVYDVEAGGYTYQIVDVINRAENKTQFVWRGLDDGDYRLQEHQKPEGYSQMADIYFSVEANHIEDAEGNYKITLLDGGHMGKGVTVAGTENEYTGSIVKEIVNLTGTVLPETGATGTALLIGGGAALIIVAAVFLITRKKMSIYEM